MQRKKLAIKWFGSVVSLKNANVIHVVNKTVRAAL